MSDAQRSAFSSLFDATHRRVWAYVVRGDASRADADDLVAEVFVVAWRRLDDVPADDPVPWLLGVARNVRRNQERSRRRATALLDRLRAEHAPDAAHPARDIADVRAIRAALGELSDTDRELLQLAAVEDLTPGQIAQVLGCRPVTARVRLHRARSRLRALLEGQSVVTPVTEVTTRRSGS